PVATALVLRQHLQLVELERVVRPARVPRLGEGGSDQPGPPVVRLVVEPVDEPDERLVREGGEGHGAVVERQVGEPCVAEVVAPRVGAPEGALVDVGQLVGAPQHLGGVQGADRRAGCHTGTVTPVGEGWRARGRVVGHSSYTRFRRDTDEAECVSWFKARSSGSTRCAGTGSWLRTPGATTCSSTSTTWSSTSGTSPSGRSSTSPWRTATGA